jgi:branched-chain amino acid transport system ATP-binding protein
MSSTTVNTRAPADGAPPPQDRARTERKRSITRWNRRLGWALVVTFPFSYLAAWLYEQNPDGTLGSWLSLLNISAQVVGTLVLAAHAAYSFYVFGFPAPRWNLRAINGYAAYFVLLVYLLSQTSAGHEPAYTLLTITSFVAIGLHVVISVHLARQRPDRGEPHLGEDARTLLDPDVQVLERIRAEVAARPASAEATTSDTPVLEAKKLDVLLGSVQVLYGVDVVVRPGETVALMGNNGAGKTTTLRTLAGLQRAANGSVHLDGFDVTKLTPAGRAELGASLVIGGRAVFGPLTVDENLRMFGSRLEVTPRELDERIDRVKDQFPWIAARADQLASTLSGGEQQMLAVSQALIVEPRILLIDEFTLGLAPKIVGELMDLVQTINARGTGVLLVEQSASVALATASRIYVMERGRIVLDDSSDELMTHPERLTDVYLKGSDADRAVHHDQNAGSR